MGKAYPERRIKIYFSGTLEIGNNVCYIELRQMLRASTRKFEPPGVATPGGSFLAGCYLVVTIQPFADEVGDNICHDRKD